MVALSPYSSAIPTVFFLKDNHAWINIRLNPAIATQEAYQEIPVFRNIDSSMVQRNYIQIKEDVKDIVTYEMERILNDPALEHLVVKKGKR